ncbi:MAG: UDP-N-acetylglucosamine 4,6-dehydratase (inverting) [Candidatus Riflebacteria bacterium]|nr:UDP-N-acetylglucosamine 4,6-dehydratase (inverting) [Candidatus Riflebacteria bacterium]
MFEDKVILVTGGTGSFGKFFITTALKELKPRKVIVFSRDEFKQFEMAKIFGTDRIRYFIGDVRDRERLYRALTGVDYVVHAAALKHVPLCEYNPFEAIQTNVFGAQNLISACIDAGVKKVVALSTDKACNPINLYGATKLCSDKLFIAANSYAGKSVTRFSAVRYGNVLGSRGSVIPLFQEMAKKGEIQITDDRMTRFWITLRQAVNFVLKAFQQMQGGELFIPKIPSMNVVDLAKAVAPEAKLKIIGIRPGEKLHESMISKDDARNLYEGDDFFVKLPDFPFWEVKLPEKVKPVSEGFEYASNLNTSWIGVDEMRLIMESEGLI